MSTYKVVTSNSLRHSWAGSDKNYTAEEKAKEKKYNHEYYMKNKEKWGVKPDGSTGSASKSTKAEYKEYSEGDSDFDDDKYSDANMIPDSDFYTFKNKDGRTVIIEEDMKWTLPEGVEVDEEMKKQLAAFKGFDDPSIKTQDDWHNAVNAIINKEKEMVSEKEHEATLGGKLKSVLEKKSTVKHSYTVITDDELYHHGIIGQKWGVRRFQNSDGSLTSAGRQRYGNSKKAGMSQQDTDTFVNESYKILTNTDNASKSVNKIKKSEAAKKKDKRNHEKYKKAKDMTDQELKEFLNRYNMEKQYNQIVNENKKDILSGSEVAKEILNVTKDVAAVAVSAATIYSILNKKN